MCLSFLVSSLPFHYLVFALFHNAVIFFYLHSFHHASALLPCFFFLFFHVPHPFLASGYISLKGIFMMLRNSSLEAEIQ